jgi:hypothetical protein
MGFYGGKPTVSQCMNNCGARTSRPGHVVWRMVDGKPEPVRNRTRGMEIAASTASHGTAGRIETGLRKFATGAAGLAKSAAGIDHASDDLIESRRTICDACPHARVMVGVFQHCGLCGCLTSAKTTLASEKCPAGKW